MPSSKLKQHKTINEVNKKSMSNTAQRFDKLIRQQTDISYFCIYSPCFPLHLVESSTCGRGLITTQCLRYGLWLSRNRFFPPVYSFDTQLHEQWLYSFHGTLINQLSNLDTVNSTTLSNPPLFESFHPFTNFALAQKIIFLVNSHFYPASVEP